MQEVRSQGNSLRARGRGVSCKFYLFPHSSGRMANYYKKVSTLNRNWLIIGVLVVLAVGLVAWLFLSLNQTGLTTGTLTVKRENNNAYFLTYTYSAPEPSLPGKPEQTYQKRVQVAASVYNYYHEGSEVNVKYNPNNPQDSQLTTDVDNISGLFGIVGVSVGALLLVGLILFVYLRRRTKNP